MSTLKNAASGYSTTYTYTYDANGNIKTVNDGSYTTTYTYDSQNQLTREDNQRAGKSWTWTYDDAGNILSKKEYAYTTGTLGSALSTKSYTYGNSNWGDLLTAYNGNTVSSDAIGNILSDGKRTYTWEHGRELATVAYNGSTWTNTYDANGMRTVRTNGSTAYSYVYNGSQLSQMTVGSNTLYFAYDASGTPLSVTYNGTAYYYATNLQGDVTAILNTSGTAAVTYTYDAWGNILTTGGSMASTLGTHNPLRYRGYVYDTETGLYYLQSRYYDPEMGRFITSDTAVSTGQGLTGNNTFAYCGNNPVVRFDHSGNAWETVWDLFSLGSSIVDVAMNPSDPWAWIGLVGDLVDVAIPFVGGIGEATRAINVAAEIVDTVDDVYDAGKAADRIDDAADAYKAMSGGLCFVAGTEVLSKDGAKAIEQIRAGDMVWAWDEETGEIALKEVVETYVNKTSNLVHIFVNGEEISSTPTHPFYSPVKGWIDAVHLRAGDILLLVNGEYVVVEKVQHEILEAPISVFNFQVKDYHNYYVSSSGVLVHNSCTKSPEMPLDGARMDPTEALTVAEDYLGTGYVEKSPGRFVSSDGRRQVRLTDSDLAINNNHAGAPHMNFELLVPNPRKPGKMRIVDNSHVFLIEQRF